MSTEREALSAAIETIAARFRSGNRVPVDKAVVPASEWSALVAALAQPVAARDEAILDLSHRMDDAAQHITERQVYDLATELRVLLGLDGQDAQAGSIASAARPVAAEAIHDKRCPTSYSTTNRCNCGA